MSNKIRAYDKADAQIEMNKKESTGFNIGGRFYIECIDEFGKVKWTEDAHNLVTNEGLDHILDVQFHDITQVTTWYVGLKGSGAVAAGDTLASHSNWTEFTDYTGDRQAYVEGAASSQSITNSGDAAAFPITGSGTVAGAFLSSVATGTSGTLFSAVDFTSSRTVANGDTINVTYTISAADDGA